MIGCGDLTSKEADVHASAGPVASGNTVCETAGFDVAHVAPGVIRVALDDEHLSRGSGVLSSILLRA